jgi:hypothetical protein
VATILKIVVLGLIGWLYISYVHNLGAMANTQIDNLRGYYNPQIVSQAASGGK